MENKEQIAGESFIIDFSHIVKILWRNAWIIIVAGVLAACVGFSIAAFAIAPTYASSIMLYVNNNSFSLGSTSFSISSSDILASRSLVSTYSEILNNRTTLERVIEKANVSYTYEELSEMIVSKPSNDTEIMVVTVTTKNPYEASDIANCIAEVLPTRISEIIEGASMEVVDSAIPVLEKVAPSITRYTVLGLIIGIFLSAAILIIHATLDDTIHDEDYIIKTYNYPILARIPNLLNSNSSKYGYYYKDSAKSESD